MSEASKSSKQYFVHVSVSRMDLEHVSIASVRSDYDYVFTMASDMPLDEMSDSAIYKQLVSGLNGLVNGVPAPSTTEGGTEHGND